MSFGGADSCWHRKHYGCALAPPGNYDGSIFAAAAMQPVAAITVATLQLPIVVTLSHSARFVFSKKSSICPQKINDEDAA